MVTKALAISLVSFTENKNKLISYIQLDNAESRRVSGRLRTRQPDLFPLAFVSKACGTKCVRERLSCLSREIVQDSFMGAGEEREEAGHL